MIDESSSKVERVANATFNQDVFGDDPEVKRLEDALADARHKCTLRKKACILVEFRGAIDEFTQKFGDVPTVVLMSYNDMQYLIEMYNDEGERLKDGRSYVSVYGSEKDRLIGGIRVRQGCDQLSGKIVMKLNQTA